LDYQSYLQGKGVPRVPGKVVDRQGTTRKGRDYKTNQEGYYMFSLPSVYPMGLHYQSYLVNSSLNHHWIK
jgi:hypothetical protein